MRLNFTLLKNIFLGAGIFVLGFSTQAGEYTKKLTHSDRGSFKSSDRSGGPLKVADDSYGVSSYIAFGMDLNRAYFSFDVSDIKGTVKGAELRIYHSKESYNTVDESETVKLYEVSTSDSELKNPTTNDGTIHSDLGSGKEFGSFGVTKGDEETYEVVKLNADAIADINAKIASGVWSLGAALTSTKMEPNNHRVEEIFANSKDAKGTELILTIEDPNVEVVNHSDRGSFKSSDRSGGPLKVVDNSYGLSSYIAFGMDLNRAYFSFDLSTQTKVVKDAELRIYHPKESYNTVDASETVKLYEVSTSDSELKNPTTNDGTIHSDLGSGKEYGSFEVTKGDEETYEVVKLSADAIADINAKIASGVWSLGAALTSTKMEPNNHTVEEVFASSKDAQATQLVLRFETVTSNPVVQENTDLVTVYPNPAVNSINVRANQSAINGVVSTVVGTQVAQFDLEANEVVNIELAPGLYIVTTNNGISQTIVVQ